jgi:hypothetical protein
MAASTPADGDTLDLRSSFALTMRKTERYNATSEKSFGTIGGQYVHGLDRQQGQVGTARVGRS